MKNNTLKITSGEEEILEILWNDGDATIRETQEALERRGRKIGYSTAQTRLERMVEKGLLTRTKSYGGKYRPTVERGDVLKTTFFDAIETLCGGNIAPLMAHLAGKRRLNRDEISTMRRLLCELDAENNDENSPESSSAAKPTSQRDRPPRGGAKQ